jgi:hypothetical protein
MKFAKASPAEKAALVRMVSASAKLIVVIGRLIKGGPTAYLLQPETVVNGASEEFIDAIIGVQEAE